jgi:hypothetical protein
MLAGVTAVVELAGVSSDDQNLGDPLLYFLAYRRGSVKPICAVPESPERSRRCQTTPRWR